MLFLSGYFGIFITVMQLVAVATSFSNESNPATCTEYSKMANQKSNKKMVSSKIGMLYIYMPALTLCTIFLIGKASFLLPVERKETPVIIMLWVHFAKRVLEVLFLHVYSGKVEVVLSRTIGFYYALVSYLISYVAVDSTTRHDDGETATSHVEFVGHALFLIGILGNFYHHYLLASLRRQSKQKRYVAPKGGLFNYVAAPHYMFELMGWLGIALVAQHANAYLVFMSMASYLSGRSVAQNKWNQQKFTDKEWPRTQRLNMIPGVF